VYSPRARQIDPRLAALGTQLHTARVHSKLFIYGFIHSKSGNVAHMHRGQARSSVTQCRRVDDMMMNSMFPCDPVLCRLVYDHLYSPKW